MSLRTTKILIQTLGGVLALVGALVVVGGLCLMPAVFHDAGLGGFILLPFIVAIGVYIAHAGYSAWRSLSPVSVRNVFGVAAFILLGFGFWLIDDRVDRSVARSAFQFLICLGGGYVSARFAGERLTKSLWPNQGAAANRR
jgi:hypothetical protein